MAHSSSHGIPKIEESEATGEVAELYDAVKREMQTPFVPNYAKAMSASPDALRAYLGMFKSVMENLTLPQALTSIIWFTIAEKSNCTYCTAMNELTCRTLGFDEHTLAAIANDLNEVNPERIRAIIEFALKAAKHPQDLELADYDAVRAQGISEGELVQIILVAGFGVLNDTIADALKLEVDSVVAEALAR